MSLEDALKANTAAVTENNELLKLLTSKAASGVKASTDAGTTETAAKPRGRPAKEKVPTPAEMKTAASTYLNVEDEEVYAERREVLIALREKYGAESIPEIKEADRAEAFAAIEKLIEDGKKPAARRDDV